MDPLKVGTTRNARHRSESAIELRLEEGLLEQATAAGTRLGLARIRIESLSGSVNATLIGRFSGRAIRDVSHPPPSWLPLARDRWTSSRASESSVPASSC
jgi:hypothetical protein